MPARIASLSEAGLYGAHRTQANNSVTDVTVAAPRGHTDPGPRGIARRPAPAMLPGRHSPLSGVAARWKGAVAMLPELVVSDFAGTTMKEEGAVLVAYRLALTEFDIPFTEDDL